MMTTFSILIPIVLALVLAFQRAAVSVWSIAYGILLVFAWFFFPGHSVSVLTIVYAVLVLVLNVLPVRRVISRGVLALFRRALPKMSETEQAALMAGTVSWEGDLFSGMPDWSKLEGYPKDSLRDDEKAFLAGPVNALCALLNDWEINHEMHALPEHVMTFIKENGFFGMIIPKEYGGLGFSALAHSQVITQLASICVAAATVVSVPNSLGPAELLLAYGTKEQKDYYLPRLASGEEIPCFALTSPVAGSDAGGMTDHGVVCEAELDGKKQLCIRLNWQKRYITLCPIATLLGLAFKLYDPDHLLGEKEELGITCALIPTNTEGVQTGRRHWPLMSAFPNGPTVGSDVLIPIDWIIGGRANAGEGWRMLMECLAAGRAISLPSMAMGGVKKAMFTSGAYAKVRQQFGVSLAQFDGIQAALARIGGLGFQCEALRLFSVTAIDRGEHAAVASAIAKAHTTEMSRQIILDAMDVHGGKGICMGPKNYLAQTYIESPICITVEGANILTRSLIIFGQGAVRCHPYVLAEMQAALANDLKAFDDAFFSHIGHLISNAVRSLVLGTTGGWGAGTRGKLHRRWVRRLGRMSAVFAFVSDVSMLCLGAKLKRLERLSERLGGMLSEMYMMSAALKYVSLHPKVEMTDVFEWSMQRAEFAFWEAFKDLLANFPNRIIAGLLRWWVNPCRSVGKPKDSLDKAVASMLVDAAPARDLLIKHVYRSQTANNPIGQIDEILSAIASCASLEKRVIKAKKEGVIDGYDFEAWVNDAVSKKIVSMEEGTELVSMHMMRMSLIHVNDFEDFSQV